MNIFLGLNHHLIANPSASLLKTKRQSRQCRIEELENREFLSASPWALAMGYGGQVEQPDYIGSVIAHDSTNSTTQTFEIAVDYCNLFDAPGDVVQEALVKISGGASAPPITAPYAFDQTFKLHSNPGAKFTIYLDFNGHTTTGTQWNTSFTKGAAIVTPAYLGDGNPNSDVTLQQIQYIWQRVAEDFIAFDVNVTTEEPPANMLKSTGVRVCIGGNSTWYSAPVGGLAYTNSFTWNSDTPVFVFSQSLGNHEKYVADAITHEVGHALGLNHHGIGTLDYYSGANGWAPVMGVGYDQAVTQWSKGDYAGANNSKQDDLAIITKTLAYRADDHGSTMGTASTLVWSGGNLDLMTGIIETNKDVDFFKFELASSGTVSFDITSGMRNQNLNVLAKIYNSSGTVVAISDLQNTMNAKFTNVSLAMGTYYLSIEGTRKAGVFSDYGSIGSYKITGSTTAKTGTGTAPVVTAPTAPANFNSSTQTANSVTLAWTSQSNLTGYTLQYRVSGATTWTTATAPATNATSATITGLAANTSYQFQLTATNSGGSAASSLNATTKVAAPTAPASLTSTAQTTTSVTLSWNAQSNLTGYTLQYRVAGTSTWTTATAPATSATSTTITGLAAGTSYNFQLTATNASGSASSTTNAKTQEETKTQEEKVTAPPVTAPSAPANFKSSTQTTNSVTLSWTSQSNLTGYTLQYRVAGTSTWTTATAPATSATSATITGLAAGTAYDFQLTAKNAGGSTASTVNATTQMATPTVVDPVAPVLNVESKSASSTSVTLTLASQNKNKDITGNAGYTVTCTEVTGNGNGNKKATSATVTLVEGENFEYIRTNGSITGIKVFGLNADTQYEFSVTAKNQNGKTASAVSIVAKTAAR